MFENFYFYFAYFQMEFPNAVGMDINRAKAYIQGKLGNTRVFFQEVIYKANRKNALSIEPRDNQVVLWIDEKWNCVAKTPSFKGRIVQQNEGEYYSDND